MEELAPAFEERFKFYWTDDPGQIANRRLLGITWEELPAVGLNSLDHNVYAYPRDEPFDRERLVHWLKSVSMKKAVDGEILATDFRPKIKDPTLYESFLE